MSRADGLFGRLKDMLRPPPAPWGEPADEGAALTFVYVADLQRLCVIRPATIAFAHLKDRYVLDGQTVHLMRVSSRTLPVEPRQVFELALGHAVIYLADLQLLTHDDGEAGLFEVRAGRRLPARLRDEPGLLVGEEGIEELVRAGVPDPLCDAAYGVHLRRQVAHLLEPSLLARADDRLKRGAASFGAALLGEGLTLTELLCLCPGWQILRQPAGHGRFELVRELIRDGKVPREAVMEAIRTTEADILDALVASGRVATVIAEPLSD